MSDYVVYEERTPWPWWVALVVAASALSAAVAVGASGGVGFLLGAALFALLPLGIWALFGVLVVRVTRTSVVVAFGPALLLQKLVSFGEIRRVEAVTYRPLLDFGGWGIRFSLRGRKRAWTIRGKRAVVLHLEDGTQLYVGSQTPERLAERICQAAGDRLRDA